MALLAFHQPLRQAFAAAATHPSIDGSLQKELKSACADAERKAVPYSLALKYWTQARQAGVCSLYFHELLQGSSIYEEPYVPPQKVTIA